MRSVLGVLAVLVLAGATPCEAREKIPLYIGYSCYFPTDSSTRDAFGSAWSKLTFGRLDAEKPDKWAMTYDLASFTRDGDCEAKLYALTLGVQRRIGPHDTGDVQPYVALRAGPYYGAVNADTLGISDRTVGVNLNAAVGVVIQERYFVEGRYDRFGSVGGFDLDGFSVSASVKVFDL